MIKEIDVHHNLNRDPAEAVTVTSRPDHRAYILGVPATAIPLTTTAPTTGWLAADPDVLIAKMRVHLLAVAALERPRAARCEIGPGVLDMLRATIPVADRPPSFMPGVVQTMFGVPLVEPLVLAPGVWRLVDWVGGTIREGVIDCEMGA